MTADDHLPVYTPEDQGLDKDHDTRKPGTFDAHVREQRYEGGRDALIKRLNDADDLLSSLHQPLSAQALSAAGVAAGAPRTAIYIRVSTEEQARAGGQAEGFSIPFQRAACTQKAQELGGIVVEVYIDAGESARSAKRPRLQDMLRDLKPKKIDLVIVHKIDRLARNRADDVEINTAIASAGAKLVSVSEPIDSTPSGRLFYNVMADIAQYHSDNLAVEVIKGMDTKAKIGGTPYRAPIGYLNKQKIEDGIDIRWVELDPERAPLVRWALEEYATGLWTVRRLVDALVAKGLTTKPGPKRPAKPITVNGVHYLLRSPYYMGVVPYRGVYHRGTHEAIITPETWLRIQDVLAAHNHAGEKDRKHPHYLKGTIFCSECGMRLVYTRNTGNGGTYEYYDCISRRTNRRPCTRRFVRLEKVEAAIIRFYEGFQISEQQALRVQDAVRAELGHERAHAEEVSQQAARRVRKLEDERQKLLQAYYKGAVPQDLLGSEMERLTREMADAEATSVAATSALTDLEGQLAKALLVASRCSEHYEEAPPAVRRLINQGFFKKLYIGEDGEVVRFDLTEPFAQVLQSPVVTGRPFAKEAAQEASTNNAESAADRSRPGAVFLTILAGDEGEHDTALGNDLAEGGVHMSSLVELRGFEPLTPSMRRERTCVRGTCTERVHPARATIRRSIHLM